MSDVELGLSRSNLGYAVGLPVYDSLLVCYSDIWYNSTV